MSIWIGTSGYAYVEWKGVFYPKDLPASKMFDYYASRFPTVENNYTFKSMPTDKNIANWSAKAPKDFRYSLKAHQSITHVARLKDCADKVKYFLDQAKKLGKHRGAVLFQLPPFLKKDTALLATFLKSIRKQHRVAFEFRHESWHDKAVYRLLSAKDAALCIAHGEKLDTPLVSTASWGYLRLRADRYTPKELKLWHQFISKQKWSDTYVYFKHEETGKGVGFAKALQKLGAK